MLDTDHALIDQHTEPVQNDASPRFRIADQRSARRIRNDVGNHHTWTKALGIEIEPTLDIGEKPNRRRIHDDISHIWNTICSIPDHQLRAGSRFLVEEGDESSPALRIPVHDCDRSRACECGLHSDRARGTASAENYERLARGIRDLAQRREEALPIGVLAEVATVPTHDAVNGADDCS